MIGFRLYCKLGLSLAVKISHLTQNKVAWYWGCSVETKGFYQRKICTISRRVLQPRTAQEGSLSFAVMFGVILASPQFSGTLGSYMYFVIRRLVLRPNFLAHYKTCTQTSRTKGRVLLFHRQYETRSRFNPLWTKLDLSHLKTQSVPRCKHFSSRL